MKIFFEKFFEKSAHFSICPHKGVKNRLFRGANKNVKLEGVEFNITGTKLNDIKETTYDRFVELTAEEVTANDGATDGKKVVYYLLKDGTYTTEPANQAAEGDRRDRKEF